jgi:DNA-binding protein HU-beta
VKDTDVTKSAAGAMLDSVLDGIAKALKKGDTVTFVGFGTFKTSVRKARTARNPRTGAPIKIAKRRVPRFTAGKALKDTVK